MYNYYFYRTTVHGSFSVSIIFASPKTNRLMKLSHSWLLAAGLLCCSFVWATTPKSGEIKPYMGRPTLHINGVPTLPDMYGLTHATGGRWSWEEVPQHNIRNFYQIGFRLFYVDIWLSDMWPQDGGPMDISLAQRQLAGVLEVAPEAAIILRIHTDAPYWWNEANRDECTEYADGPIQEHYLPGPPHNNEDFSIMRSLRASLASQKWKHEAGQRFQELLNGLSQTEEGNALVGVHPAGGIYGEWHYWGFVDHDPDTGPAMTRYFRQWLQKKYGSDAKLQQAWRTDRWTIATATVPGVAEREATQYGQFKDPQTERRVIDYIEAQQEAVVEDIEYFCRLAKETWPRPLITGAFYGYLHMTFNRQTVGGHLLVERILECPYIDYLAAPQTYYKPSRRLGGSGMPRGIVESAALHGKLWFDEMDNGELARRVCHDAVRYVERYDRDYAPVLRRSVVLPLMRGTGVWYYDFGLRESIGWFDDPVYLQSIRDEKALFERQMHRPFQSEADVLYVWNQESYYYLLPQGTPISSNVVDQSIEEALRSGTVGDHIYDFDLERVNLDQYKAIVFMNDYALSDRVRKFIREKVAKNGRTLIYNYLTGVIDGRRYGLDLSEKLSGVTLKPEPETQAQTLYFHQPAFEFTFKGVVDPSVVIDDPQAETLATLKGTDKVVIARKQFSDHTVIYATLPINGTDVFRELFRQAGCHVYNDHNDFTYVNTGVMLIHTADGGPREIFLKNGKTLRLNLPPKSNTVLDASTGEPLLKEYIKEIPSIR